MTRIRFVAPSSVHGPGGICLEHGLFDGYRCGDCLARERARAERPPTLLARLRRLTRR